VVVGGSSPWISVSVGRDSLIVQNKRELSHTDDEEPKNTELECEVRWIVLLLADVNILFNSVQQDLEHYSHLSICYSNSPDNNFKI